MPHDPAYKEAEETRLQQAQLNDGLVKGAIKDATPQKEASNTHPYIVFPLSGIGLIIMRIIITTR